MWSLVQDFKTVQIGRKKVINLLFSWNNFQILISSFLCRDNPKNFVSCTIKLLRFMLQNTKFSLKIGFCRLNIRELVNHPKYFEVYPPHPLGLRIHLFSRKICNFKLLMKWKLAYELEAVVAFVKSFWETFEIL